MNIVETSVTKKNRCKIIARGLVVQAKFSAIKTVTMLTLEPKTISINKPDGRLSIQTPLKVTLSHENFLQSIDEEKISGYALTDDLVQDEFWQAYLASEQEWEEVYRRLAES